MKRKHVIFAGAVLALTPLLAACTSDTSPAATSGEPDKVTIALDWLAQPSNGGYYVAEAMGYYDDAGIDVTIQAGGTSASSVQVVAGGGAQFGLEYGAKILEAREAGIDIVSLAPTLQKSPSGYLYHAGQDIDSIADFNGRTVYTQVSSLEWEYLVKEYNLDNVNAVQFDYNYASFANDETAIVQGYATDSIDALTSQGIDVEFFSPPSNIDYGASLFATQELIDADPDLVKRFVAASIKGWDYYYQHNDEASKIVSGFIEDATLETTTAGGLAQQPYIWTDEVLENGFGYQTADRWEAITELAVKEGVITDPSVADGAWTTEFLPSS